MRLCTPAQAHESWVVVGLFSLEIHERSFLHCQEHQQHQQQQQLLQKVWGKPGNPGYVQVRFIGKDKLRGV
jgi:hypothetical protein